MSLKTSCTDSPRNFFPVTAYPCLRRNKKQGYVILCPWNGAGTVVYLPKAIPGIYVGYHANTWGDTNVIDVWGEWDDLSITINQKFDRS